MVQERDGQVEGRVGHLVLLADLDQPVDEDAAHLGGQVRLPYHGFARVVPRGRMGPLPDDRSSSFASSCRSHPERFLQVQTAVRVCGSEAP